MRMLPSVPYISVDMAAATLVTGLLELQAVTDHAIIINTKIQSMTTEDSKKGHFLLVPDSDSIQKFFHALGIKYDDTN